MRKHNETILVKLLDYMVSLGRIERVIQAPHIPGYTVASHSFNVAILSFLIATDLRNKAGYKKVLRLNRILVYSLLHDFKEAVTNDIPYPTKKYLSKYLNADWDKMESLVLFDNLSAPIGERSDPTLDKIVYALMQVDSTSQLNKKETILVNFCDMLEFFLWCSNEMLSGNRHPTLINMYETAYNILGEDNYAWILCSPVAKSIYNIAIERTQKS